MTFHSVEGPVTHWSVISLRVTSFLSIVTDININNTSRFYLLTVGGIISNYSISSSTEGTKLADSRSL